MTDNLPQRAESNVAMTNRGVQLRTFEDAMAFSASVVGSGLAPQSFNTAEKVFVAVQHGAEIGLSPMQSLQSIAVINGKPSIYGDALPGLAWSSGVLDEFNEWFESDRKGDPTPDGADDDSFAAVCFTRRKGQKEGRTTRFTVAMAKRAGLWGKLGPWKQYPQRMLQMRARSWNFRDNLADVLKGLSVREEVADYDAPAHPQSESPPASIAQLAGDELGESDESVIEHDDQREEVSSGAPLTPEELEEDRKFQEEHSIFETKD